MKYTNKLNLPQSIYNVIINDDYDPGDSDITVTQLIQPIQMTKLQQQYKNLLVEDISDNIYALMGKAIHYILEKAENIMPVEKRLYIEIEGIKLSGQFDRHALISLQGGFASKLQDYKFASIWEYIFGLNKEREEQLNCLAYILNRKGYNVKQAEIIMIFRDWQKSKAQYDKNYPQQQVAIFNVPLWIEKKQLNYIKGRINLYKGYYYPCSQEERWNQGDKFAVMRDKKKKALRVFDTYEQALNWINKTGRGDNIERRPAENKRCEYYCNVKNFCEQYKRMQNETQTTTANI